MLDRKANRTAISTHLSPTRIGISDLKGQKVKGGQGFFVTGLNLKELVAASFFSLPPCYLPHWECVVWLFNLSSTRVRLPAISARIRAVVGKSGGAQWEFVSKFTTKAVPCWDLIINVLIGLTLIGLPLTVGAIVRALWLRYRITNRRITVTGGWMGRSHRHYLPVVKKVPRGIILGRYGVNARDGSRLELRQFLSSATFITILMR